MREAESTSDAKTSKMWARERVWIFLSSHSANRFAQLKREEKEGPRIKRMESQKHQIKGVCQEVKFRRGATSTQMKGGHGVGLDEKQVSHHLCLW